VLTFLPDEYIPNWPVATARRLPARASRENLVGFGGRLAEAAAVPFADALAERPFSPA